MDSGSLDREGSICIEGSINAGVAGLSVNVCGGTCDELKRELDRLFNECGADVLNLLKSKAIEIVKAPTTKVRDAIYWFLRSLYLMYLNLNTGNSQSLMNFLMMIGVNPFL